MTDSALILLYIFVVVPFSLLMAFGIAELFETILENRRRNALRRKISNHMRDANERIS